jgi:hypothetical protein
VIKGAPYAIQRASSLLIYVSLLSGIGLASLALSKHTLARASAALLTIVMVWQFAGFSHDYHGIYRIGSGHAYDPTAFRGAADAILNSDRERAVDAVYLPANFYDVGAKWRFYTLKYDRRMLWQHTHYFESVSTLGDAPPNAMAVLPYVVGGVPTPEGWRVVDVVKNLMAEPTAVVIRRAP